MIELCNLRKEKPCNPWDVKVDRSSVLGNPFHSGSRNYVCDQYEKAFEDRVRLNLTKYAELQRLLIIHKQYGKLRLFCWCTPLRCHSETIKYFLEQRI